MTKSYRGCNICKHYGEPAPPIRLPEDYEGLVLSHCAQCDRDHDQFQLDEEKLTDEIELELMSKTRAKYIQKRNERRSNV